jgi:hypothetical protein
VSKRPVNQLPKCSCKVCRLFILLFRIRALIC